MSYQILIVEDDDRIASSIHAYLSRFGYQPFLVGDFQQVEGEFLRIHPHLVIMDINLPYQDGFHLCRQIRRHSSVPILFLTARSGEMEQVLGIESGGDDYITKPFHLEVVHAKIKALLRRAYGEYAKAETAGTQMHAGALTLDLAAGEVRYKGEAQSLTPTELKLLHLLMERPDRPVSRDRCLEALWENRNLVDDNTLTVNITRLRMKLDAWGLKEAIQTRRGMGYQLVTQQLEEPR